MEDPVRKVGAGGTAGGDRWEGEDEDEDVKVGAGRGCGLRRRGRSCPALGGRTGGRTLGPGALPGPASPGSGASSGPAAARSPCAHRRGGRDGQRGLSGFLGEAAAALPQPLPFVAPRPGLHPTRQLATGGDSSGRAAHVRTSWSGASRRMRVAKRGRSPTAHSIWRTWQRTCLFELLSPQSQSFICVPEGPGVEFVQLDKENTVASF